MLQEAGKSLLEQVGLPETWQPLPIAYSFVKIGIQADDGPKQLHLMMLDTVSGREAFAFDDKTFREFANKILEQTSGLHVASGLVSDL